MVAGFDLHEFLQNVKATKPPYQCPYDGCEKVFKTFKGIHTHVLAHSKEGGSEPEDDDPLTYVDAQKVVEFLFDGKAVHVSMYEPLALFGKDDFETKYPDSIKEPNSTSDAPKTPACKVNGGKITGKKGSKNGSKNCTPKSTKIGGVDDPPNDVPPDSDEKKVVKLPEPQVTVLDSYDIPDAPERPKNYYRYIEKSLEELDDEVEYDMDEEDSAWLEMMNSKRKFDGLAPLSVSDFELLMDRLEKESYFQVQSTGKHHGPPIDEDAVCCICNDGECENTNVILFCDMCNLAVHQECYGIPYIPEGQWLCRRCLQSPSRSVDCALCPNKGGAFKQTDDNRWAHVVCALWIPEVMFANLVFLEPIDSIQNIPAARWRLTCYICKQRGAGACIQCHRPNCYTAFHVTCAQQAGLHMKMDTVRETATSGMNVSVRKEAYCDAHTPLDSECKYMEDLGEGADPSKVEARAAFRKRIRYARKILEEKRTAPRIVSVPTIPPEKVRHIASLIAAQGRNSFILRLIAYWTLKRQSRNGVPLIRRLQTHPSKRNEEKKEGRNKKDEVLEELRYWQRLRQDLEKARLLCELVRKREKTKKELIRMKEREFELRLTPQFFYIRRLLDTLQDKDTSDIFGEPVDPREVPDYYDIIKKPMDFSTMRKKLDDHEYRDLNDFAADFNLIVDNCMQYNDDNSPYFKIAQKLKEQGTVLIKQARRELEGGRDESRGSSVSDTPTNSPKSVDHHLVEEIDEILAKSDDKMDPTKRISELMDAQDKAQGIKQGMARNKRLKLLRQEISKVRRKLSLIEDREIVSTSENNTPKPRNTKKQKVEVPNKEKEGVKESQKTVVEKVKSVQKPVHRRQVVEKPRKTLEETSSSSSDSSSESSSSSSSTSSSDSDLELPKLTPMVPAKTVSVPKTKQTRIDSFLVRNVKKPNVEKSSSEDEDLKPQPRQEHRNGIDARPKAVQKKTPKAAPRRPLERLSDSSTDSEAEAISPSRPVKGTPAVTENGGNKNRAVAKVMRGRQKADGASQLTVSKIDPYSTPVKSGGESGSVHNSPAGVNRRTSVLFNKKAAASIQKPDFGRTQPPQKSGPKKKAEPPPRGPPDDSSDSDSDTPVRSMFDPDLLRGDGELDSLAKEKESFKIYRSSSSESDSGSESSDESDSESDSEDSSESDIERSSSLIPLEPLDLVWAKCRGYPWYPALIINPKMPRTGYYHNGVPIPVPPQDVLDLAASHTEPKFLVLFFDSKRTWQWLPRSKLELLGMDPNNDKSKLVDSKKPTDRKAVKKAYEEAILHRSRVTGETHSLSGESEDAE